MVKRNAIATKLTKVCTQTQKWAFDVAVYALQDDGTGTVYGDTGWYLVVLGQYIS